MLRYSWCRKANAQPVAMMVEVEWSWPHDDKATVIILNEPGESATRTGGSAWSFTSNLEAENWTSIPQESKSWLPFRAAEEQNVLSGMMYDELNIKTLHNTLITVIIKW